MHFAWHAQYKRHLHQRCWEVRALISSDGLHFGASDLHFAKMILRHRCGTSYDLASVFRGRYSTLDRWNGKKRKTHWYEAVNSVLNFPFFKDVSQNCFIFDVVNFENGRKSRRIASFLKLSSSKNENVSQACFVFDVVNFEKLMKSRRIASFFKLAGRQIDK